MTERELDRERASLATRVMMLMSSAKKYCVITDTDRILRTIELNVFSDDARDNVKLLADECSLLGEQLINLGKDFYKLGNRIDIAKMDD